MNLQTAIRYRLLSLCGERSISIQQLALLSGISKSTVKNIFYKATANPTIRTIKILCDGLEITLDEFFSSPEFKSLEQEIK